MERKKKKEKHNSLYYFLFYFICIIQKLIKTLILYDIVLKLISQFHTHFSFALFSCLYAILQINLYLKFI